MNNEDEAENILKRIQLARDQCSITHLDEEFFKGIIELVQKQAKRIDILEEELNNIRGRVDYSSPREEELNNIRGRVEYSSPRREASHSNNKGVFKKNMRLIVEFYQNSDCGGDWFAVHKPVVYESKEKFLTDFTKFLESNDEQIKLGGALFFSCHHDNLPTVHTLDEWFAECEKTTEAKPL